MASYRVRDLKGVEFEVHSKEQADQWVAVGYALVEDSKPKATTQKRAAKKAASSK